jgi:excisionase family DNA binding protein
MTGRFLATGHLTAARSRLPVFTDVEVARVPTVYLTTAEVAEVLKCSPETVVSYCRRRELEHIKVRRQYRIPEHALEAFAARGGTVQADARRMLDTSIGEGLLPAEAPPEVLGKIAEILRQHYTDQATRTATTVASDS